MLSPQDSDTSTNIAEFEYAKELPIGLSVITVTLFGSPFPLLWWQIWVITVLGEVPEYKRNLLTRIQG